MGRLLDGKWITTDLGPDAQGRFVRRATQFRNTWEEMEEEDVSVSGGGGSVEDAFLVNNNKKKRYILLIGSPCGWSHRVLLVRALMGLEDFLPVIFTDAYMGEDGWTFYGRNNNSSSEGSNTEEEKKKGGIMAKELYMDPVGAGYSDPSQIIVQKMYEAYVLAKNDYTGRCSVPVLWDRQAGTIVNNESSDLITMLSSEIIKPVASHPVDLVPTKLKDSIEAMKDANYKPINNGVYRCGFAGNQEAYTEAATELFKRLDELEELLGRQRYLCSNNQVTMADICLFPTLYRFDAVYYTHFKTNRRHIYEYKNLWGWLRELYQMPGVAQTCKMKECCEHYYTSHESIHPRRYVPLGPDLDFDEAHGRDTVTYS